MHGFEVKPKKEKALEDEYEEELSDEELEELEEEEDENEGVGAEKSEFLDRVLDIVKAIFEDVLRGVRSDNPKNTQVVRQGVNTQKPLQRGSDVKTVS
jgi:ribosome assembly protein YihI (activator of Der GTPase)